MSDTVLMKSRLVKKVFKAPVKGDLTPGEDVDKTVAVGLPKNKKPSHSTGYPNISGLENSVLTGNKTKLKKVKKTDTTPAKPLSKVDICTKLSSENSPIASFLNEKNNKNVKSKKVKSLTDAEYVDIFSSVLSMVQYDNTQAQYVKDQKKVQLKEGQNDEVKAKKQKLDFSDDSFHTPVFEDLAIKKKKKKIKKQKIEKTEPQLSQKSTTSAGAKTPPSKKPVLPPISPWGSHFAKLNSQGSSLYKPSDESQSIVGSLFEDDDNDKPSLLSLAKDKKVKNVSASSESESGREADDSGSEEEVTSSTKVKQKLRKGDIDKDVQSRLETLHEDRNVGLWVLCDHSACQKHRYLPHITDPLDLPDKWYCSMNPDPLYNSCSKPEHGPSKEEEDYLIHNLYNAGSLVWARVDGYPWWPAMVDDCPDFELYYWLEGSMIPTWYHVVFFGEEVTRAWLKPHAIAPYRGQETAKRFKQTKPCGVDYRARLSVAKKQVADAASLSTYERLKIYSFIARYKKPLGDLVKQNKKLPKATKTVPMKAKARTQQVKVEKMNKFKDISKVQLKDCKIVDKKIKKGNKKETDCSEDTIELISKKVLNNMVEKKKSKKTNKKESKHEETLHPALGKVTKLREMKKVSDNIESTFFGNVENESEGTIFSDGMLKELLTQKYICKKVKETVTSADKESMDKVEKSLKDETSNTENNECNSVYKLPENVTKKDSNKTKKTENSVITEPTKQNKNNETILETVSNDNVKIDNELLKTEKENILNLSVVSNSENILSINEGENTKPKDNRTKLNTDENSENPDSDVCGEIQSQEVGSTQGTVCENIELIGNVTSTNEIPFNMRIASEDIFSDQEVSQFQGDAIVPTLSQLSLPFECEE